MVYLYDACDQISDFCHQQLLRKMQQKITVEIELLNAIEKYTEFGDTKNLIFGSGYNANSLFQNLYKRSSKFRECGTSQVVLLL